MKVQLGASVLILAFLGCDQAKQTAAPAATPSSPAAVGIATLDSTTANDENTKTSKTDDPSDSQTNPTDEQITESIRKQLLDSKMSVNLGNIKISTLNGKVTLRGLVKTAEEKIKVEEIAQAVAGDNEVSSAIEVE